MNPIRHFILYLFNQHIKLSYPVVMLIRKDITMRNFSSNLLYSFVLFTFLLLQLYGCAGLVYHRDIIKTNDGSYIIVKGFSEIEGGKTVIKLRSNMIEEWQWQIEQVDNYQMMNISKEQGEILNLLETKDSSFVGVGRKKSESKSRAGNLTTTSTFYNPLIFKLDSSGEKSWGVVHKNNGWLYNVVQISDRDFIACGAIIRGYKRGVIPQENGLLIRFNQSGKILWSKELLNIGRCNLIIQTEDKEILLVGYEKTEVPNRNLIIAKLDPDGIPVWQKIIDLVSDGTEIVEQYGGLLESNEGSYVLAGNILFGKYEGYMFVVCLSFNGMVKWKKLIELEDASMVNSPIIYDIKQLATNDYVIVGTMVNTNLGFLTKISSNGKELMTVGTYNEGKREALRRIHANADGTFTLYGLSSEGGPGEKVWTIELNPNGEILNGN